MKVKALIVALLFIPAISNAALKPEVYRDQITLTGGVKNLSEALEGCETHSGAFRAKRLQYSDSGNLIKLIQFSRQDGEVYAIPTNFDQLSKSQYSDIQKIIEEGQRYWITFSVCGSGGYTSLMSMSYTIGM